MTYSLWKISIFYDNVGTQKNGTVEDMTDRAEDDILICIGNIGILYDKRIFKIETILVDPEFGPYKDEIRNNFGITFSLSSRV